MKKVLIYLVMILACLAALMALFPAKFAEIAIAAERTRGGLSHKTLVIGDERWHYLEGGPEDADAVVLLHGFGGDKDNWTRFSRYLTEQYRVIAPDLPGFGESARHPDWDYSLPAQRDRFDGFATALGLDAFHIAGNSMGGHLAVLYAHQYPSNVKSMGLFNNGGVVPSNPSDLQMALEEGRNPLVADTVEQFSELIDFVTFKRPFIPWPLESVFAQRAVDNADFNRYIFNSLAGEHYVRLEPILPDIECSVLILWGEHDRVLDVSSIDVMEALIPIVEVVIMTETGHLPMIERPSATAEHYLEFLGKN